jgi:hypothetical protein
MEVSCVLFDIKASIEKTVEFVRPLAEKKGLALHVELGQTLGHWVSDPRRIEQILINLLNNAIKFTERGQVTQTVEIATDVLRMSVHDTGIGVKPHNLQQVFKPFRQFDTRPSGIHEGTGLGLGFVIDWRPCWVVRSKWTVPGDTAVPLPFCCPAKSAYRRRQILVIYIGGEHSSASCLAFENLTKLHMQLFVIPSFRLLGSVVSSVIVWRVFMAF